MRTLLALHRTLSALAAPFLAPALHTVDGNVRGEDGCEDNFIRTVDPFIRTRDTFSRTKPSIRILKHCHAFPSDALGETCGA